MGGHEWGREVCSDDACAEGRVTSVSSLLRSAPPRCAVCSPSKHGNTLPDLKAAFTGGGEGDALTVCWQRLWGGGHIWLEGGAEGQNVGYRLNVLYIVICSFSGFSQAMTKQVLHLLMHVKWYRAIVNNTLPLLHTDTVFCEKAPCSH